MRRRHFLGLAALTSLAGPRLAWSQPHAELARHLRGPLLLPGQEAYEQARKVWNPRLDIHPGPIAMCLDEADVQTCVQWAAAARVPCTVRAGGHNYEGFCLGPGLVIDVSSLQHIDLSTGEVGAGCRQGSLYAELARAGLGFPGGSCPTVGLTGFALGGGYGLLGRAFGLGCDNVTAFQLVGADGRSRRVAEGDLAWALRGAGGGNFGVVTRLVLKLRKVGPVTLFRRRWSWEQAEQVGQAWLDWAPHADERYSSALSLSGGANPSVRLLGIFLGEGRALRQPPVGRPHEDFARTMPLVEALQVLGGDPRQATSCFKVFSDFVQRPLPAEGWRELVRELSVVGPFSPKVQLDSFGGRINARAPGDTAFWHRRSLACLQAMTFWNKRPGAEAAALEHLAALRSAYAPFASGQAYQNYVDLSLEHPLQAYYGGNLARLLKIREVADPEGLFQFPQVLKRAK